MAKTARKGAKKTSGRGLAQRARSKAKVEARRATEVARRSHDGKRLSKKELAELKKRDELIAQYMPYAASIAHRVAQSLSAAVDYEEVLCNARLGLLEAAKRFDTEQQEADFKTFAYYRIKGAIYDGLRRSGWLPRTLYAKIKFEEAANEYLQNRSLHSSDGPAHKCTAYHLDDDTVAETVNTLASIYIVSLDASEDMDVEDTNQTCVERRTEFMQIRQHMRDAINTLPEKERMLVMMYYFQNRTLEEVGERLGLSKSWTSRLHTRALSLLFKRIRNRAMVDNNKQGDKEEE